MMRWRCERLSLESYSHPCSDARKRDLANCVGCSGAVDLVDLSEEGVMGKADVIRGKVKAAQAAQAAQKMPRKYDAPFIDVSRPIEVVAPELHVVNLVELFRARQQAELEQFIAGLTSCGSDRDRLQYAYQRVCA